MTDTPELKPCPFCGSTDVSFNDYANDGYAQIQCDNCDASGVSFWPENYMDACKCDAIEAWNRRVGK